MAIRLKHLSHAAFSLCLISLLTATSMPSMANASNPELLVANSDIYMKEIVRHFDATYETSYQTTTSVSESTGVYKYDCSGLIDYSIKRVLPEAYQHFKDVLGSNFGTRLSTIKLTNYFKEIESKPNPYWSLVPELIHVVPGDVIVYRHSSNTAGHVVTVKQNLGYKPGSGNSEVLLEVYDSAESRHSSDSTRYHGTTLSRGETGGGGTNRTGLGFGTMSFTTNKVKYRWRGTEADSPLQTIDSMHIGRLTGVVRLAIPDAPSNLSATSGSQKVGLTWTASVGATSYNLKRVTEDGKVTTVRTGAVGTTYVESGLTNGTTYRYVVTAVNAAGESQHSMVATATPTGENIPSAPTNLTATANPQGARSITLNWTAVSGATSYRVYRATSPAGTYSSIKTGLTTTTHTHSSLTVGKTYYYKVRAVNGLNLSGYSNMAYATAQ